MNAFIPHHLIPLFLLVLAGQTLGERCVTCKNEECNSREPTILECTDRISQLPFNVKLTHDKDSEAAKHACIDLVYSVDGFTNRMKQCIVYDEKKELSICDDLRTAGNVLECYIHTGQYDSDLTKYYENFIDNAIIFKRYRNDEKSTDTNSTQNSSTSETPESDKNSTGSSSNSHDSDKPTSVPTATDSSSNSTNPGTTSTVSIPTGASPNSTNSSTTSTVSTPTGASPNSTNSGTSTTSTPSAPTSSNSSSSSTNSSTTSTPSTPTSSSSSSTNPGTTSTASASTGSSSTNSSTTPTASTPDDTTANPSPGGSGSGSIQSLSLITILAVFVTHFARTNLI